MARVIRNSQTEAGGARRRPFHSKNTVMKTTFQMNMQELVTVRKFLFLTPNGFFNAQLQSELREVHDRIGRCVQREDGTFSCRLPSTLAFSVTWAAQHLLDMNAEHMQDEKRAIVAKVLGLELR